MSFLDNFKRSTNNQMPSDWNSIQEISQLSTIINNSSNKPVLIFKHSTSCGISSFALSKTIDKWNDHSDLFDFFYLDLLNYREISNAIAAELKITHQSPQIILIQDGVATFNASHHAIDLEEIAGLVNNNL